MISVTDGLLIVSSMGSALYGCISGDRYLSIIGLIGLSVAYFSLRLDRIEKEVTRNGRRIKSK